MKKKTLRIFTIALFVTFLCISTVLASETVTILHQNDVHGWFFPEETKVSWARVQEMIKDEFVQEPSSLYILAGDLFTGPPFPKELKSVAEYKVWNLFWEGFGEMKDRVWISAGNHEFDDKPFDPSLFESPILCANLVKDGKLVMTPYAIVKTAEGLRIGIIGLIMEDLDVIAGRGYTEGLIQTSKLEAVKKSVAEIGDLDLTIISIHDDIEDIEELAASIPKELGVDLIVSGHSHLELHEPKKVNDIYIVQAGSNNDFLGYAKLVVDKGKIVSLDQELVPLVPTPLEKYLAYLKTKVDEVMGPTIAAIERPLIRSREGECTAGNFVADTFRWKTGTDIAMTNSGSLRIDIPVGELKEGQLKILVPWGNHLLTTELTGKLILQILEGEAAIQRNQVSGLSYKFDSSKPEGKRVTEVLINGKPLEPDKIYTFTYNSYCADDSKIKKYLNLEPGILIWNDTGYIDNETMIDYAKELKVIAYELEGRIVDVAK
ncbi:5'-nucleotidase C-terminal domain-containing protein [bacterium]|nr:5'-nucleotidase C-terminal domain-containing protein [bacterium]